MIKQIKTAGEANPPVNQTERKVTKYLIRVSDDGVTFEDFEPVSRRFYYIACSRYCLQ